MTLKQIEYLTAGPATDAEIEARFFGVEVTACGDGFYYVWENEDAESRPLRPFSTDVVTALKILEACPGWRMWQTLEGQIYKINVQLSVRKPERPDGRVDTITACGTDISIALAICKAALLLVHYIQEWGKPELKPTLTLEGNYHYHDYKEPDEKVLDGK